MEKALKQLRQIDKEIVLLAHAASLLGWDQETYMPTRALQERSEQIALLQGMIHEKITDPRCAEFLTELGATQDNPDGAPKLSELERAFVREAFRRYTRAVKIPQSLVIEMAKTTSIAQGVWIRARKNSDFKLFQPHLEKIIVLLKQIADCLGYTDSVYDPLLDEYEPWMTCKQVEEVFNRLKQPLIQLVQQIVTSQQQIDDTVLKRRFLEDNQAKFNLFILKAMNFDFERGRLDISTHPFTTTLGMDDVRLTTRYNEEFFPTIRLGKII